MRMPCLALTAFVLASPALVAADQPAKPAAPATPAAGAKPAASAGPTITSFLKIRVPSAVSIAPSGAVYCRDFPDGINQLYRRDAGASLNSPMKKLTDFKDGFAGYSLSPDGKTLAISAAIGGNENTNIWVMDAATDKLKEALQNPEVQFSVQAWLRDSSGFIYRANDKSPSDFYIYRYDLKDGKSTQLLAEKGDWSVSDVTDDASRLLVSNYKSASDSRAFELDVKTGKLRDISATPTGTESANSLSGYLPGEKACFLESDFKDGMARLYVRDLSTDSTTPPTEALPASLNKFELDGASPNQERTHFAVALNEDGFGSLHVFSLSASGAGKEIALPTIEKGLVFPADFRGTTLLYSVSSANNAGLTYAVDLAKPGEAKAITARVDSEQLDLAQFRPAELVKYKSFDGMEIPAFLYLPANFKKGTPIPFVVNYHGGPEGQHRPGFDRVSQYLVSKGYGVLQPNVRGSTGYGREFQMADNYKNRIKSVKDGVEGARWLVKEGYSQNKKVAAYGGSYGGFMSVACIIEGPDVFGASVDVVGIVNMKTFLEQTKGYRRALREAEYGPLTDPEFLKTVSSIHRIDEIKCPMMIAHGLNDPRVPVGEAMQLAVALQKRGDDPELLFFPDEGHGFAKLENRIIFNERMVKFLDKHIGAGGK